MKWLIIVLVLVTLLVAGCSEGVTVFPLIDDVCAMENVFCFYFQSNGGSINISLPASGVVNFTVDT